VPKLDGKIALVTGGNSGIGLATARLFAAEGAQVVITGRRKDALDQAVSDLGSGALGIAGDVANLDDLDRLYTEINRRFGRLDIVFANAGILTLKPMDQITPDQFDQEFAVNVRGLFFTVQKALPLMTEGGSIILTSSIAHFTGLPNFSLYGGAKAAVRAFARSWTSELAGRGIRVNVLSPGPTSTPMAGKMGVPLERVLAAAPERIAQIPLGRFGEPEETAKAALFLASGDSSFVAGIDLVVDGGMGQV
jgi:NAD(P)-dependent dehydrogenase (short-subunit alcohol dehydrogenase family)